MRPTVPLFAAMAILMPLVQAQSTTGATSKSTTASVSSKAATTTSGPVCSTIPLSSCTSSARSTQCSLVQSCACSQFSALSACFSSNCGGATGVPTAYIEDVNFWCSYSIGSASKTATGAGGASVTSAATTAAATAATTAAAASTSKAGADALAVQVGGVFAAMIAILAYL